MKESGCRRCNSRPAFVRKSRRGKKKPTFHDALSARAGPAARGPKLNVHSAPPLRSARALREFLQKKSKAEGLSHRRGCPVPHSAGNSPLSAHMLALLPSTQKPVMRLCGAKEAPLGVTRYVPPSAASYLLSAPPSCCTRVSIASSEDFCLFSLTFCRRRTGGQTWWQSIVVDNRIKLIDDVTSFFARSTPQRNLESF